MQRRIPISGPLAEELSALIVLLCQSLSDEVQEQGQFQDCEHREDLTYAYDTQPWETKVTCTAVLTSADPDDISDPTLHAKTIVSCTQVVCLLLQSLLQCPNKSQ